MPPSLLIRAAEKDQKAREEGKGETSVGGRCIERTRREVLLEETRPSRGNIEKRSKHFDRYLLPLYLLL